MDNTRFDQIAKVVSTGMSRRSSLGWLLATVAGVIPIADTAAKQRKNRAEQRKPKPCRPPKKKCGRKCVAIKTDRNNCGACRRACTTGQVCRGGACKDPCTPACADKTCGGNGCGGSCGSCGGGATCVNGTCQTECTRSCAGKNCGSDGCGGSCGTCSGGRVCSNPGSGGTCQCAAVSCGGDCCAAGQRCFGAACWPDDQESAFVTLITNHRAANSVPPLTLQHQLGEAAELHSQDQATNNFMGHAGSDGSTVPQRFTRAGYNYSWWGENVYAGGATANDAFTWWRGSPGHNANMLSTNFTQFGIGRARSSSGTWYWTTTFGRPQ